MKRGLLIFTFSIIFGAGLLSIISRQAGYILIAVGHSSIEISLWVAVFLLIAFAGLSWLALRLLSRLTGWRATKNQKTINRGLTAFIEEDWRKAITLLSQSATKSKSPVQHYLLAAKASLNSNDKVQAEKLIQRADVIAIENNSQKVSLSEEMYSAALIKAKLQRQNEQWQECLATLEPLIKSSPNHPAVLLLLKDVYFQLERWADLKKLLPKLKRRTNISTEAVEKLSSAVKQNN